MTPTNILAVIYENIIYIIIFMFLICVSVTSFINYFNSTKVSSFL